MKATIYHNSSSDIAGRKSPRLSVIASFNGLTEQEEQLVDCFSRHLEGYAQLASGNYRKPPMAEIIERAERELREKDNA